MAFEDLKEGFIVEKEKYEENFLGPHITKIKNYCVVYKDGNVSYKDIKLTVSEKIRVALVARFLANKLEPSIANEMSVDELFTSIGTIDKGSNSLNVRLSNEVTHGYITRTKRKMYMVPPYKIPKILSELPLKEQDKKQR